MVRRGAPGLHAALALAALLAVSGCRDKTGAPGADASAAGGAAGGAAGQPGGKVAPLAPDDVSWLFPPPRDAADLSRLIAVSDMTGADGGPLWPASAFADFIRVVDGPAGEVRGVAGSAAISLPEEARRETAWFIAGVRLDAGAPGLSEDVIAQFGQRPQLRLILHPVLRQPDGSIAVQDIAAHLIFDLIAPASQPPAAPGCLPRAVPDLAATKAMFLEAAALRVRLEGGAFGPAVTTAGPLSVHPGLSNPATAAGTRAAMMALIRHVAADARLHAMSAMGLPAQAPSPWIFLAMLRGPDGHFSAVPSPALDGVQTAMLIQPVGISPRVAPTPAANNEAPATCVSAMMGPGALPPARRRGVATARLLEAPPDPARLRDVTALIADPARAHFFNTDCVSCHTETRLAMSLGPLDGPDVSVLPNGPWNVRNFGWSPAVEGPVSGTATRRSAAETEAVLRFVNGGFLEK